MLNTSIEPKDFVKNDQSKMIHEMEELYRGELSAVEAYQQVLEKIEGQPEHSLLKSMLADHRSAVAFWQKQIERKQLSPERDSGAWGMFVKAFVGTAKIGGNRAALNALKEGEEHGLNSYISFLSDNSPSKEVKTYVKDTMIPDQRRHLHSIDNLMKMQ